MDSKLNEELLFSSIYIGDDNFKEYKYRSNSDFLEKLSRVNIFIGINNSGKSRFLRKLFGNNELKFLSDALDVKSINNNIDLFLSGIQDSSEITTNPFLHLEKEINSLKNSQILYLMRQNDFQGILKDFSKINDYLISISSQPNPYYKLKLLSSSIYNELKSLIPKDNNITFYNYDTIYIPTLRGLRPTQTLTSTDRFNNDYDNYFFRTIADYFVSNQKLVDNIYTGLNLYEDLQKFMRGNPQQREQLKQFQTFLSLRSFFNNQEVELIPTINKDTVDSVKIGGDEKQIFNLGDGIQSIIILTYPLFLNKEKTLKVFIEEPEFHLHPGYQRKFIETLLSPEFKKVQFFYYHTFKSFLGYNP